MLETPRIWRRGALFFEVHECLTVLTPWAGPVRVDVTVDPPLAARGVPATLDRDVASDMALAIDADGPGWSVPRADLRAAKERLRQHRRADPHIAAQLRRALGTSSSVLNVGAGAGSYRVHGLLGEHR